jgi:hypothetical protein
MFWSCSRIVNTTLAVEGKAEAEERKFGPYNPLATTPVAQVVRILTATELRDCFFSTSLVGVIEDCLDEGGYTTTTRGARRIQEIFGDHQRTQPVTKPYIVSDEEMVQVVRQLHSSTTSGSFTTQGRLGATHAIKAWPLKLGSSYSHCCLQLRPSLGHNMICSRSVNIREGITSYGIHWYQNQLSSCINHYHPSLAVL